MIVEILADSGRSPVAGRVPVRAVAMGCSPVATTGDDGGLVRRGCQFDGWRERATAAGQLDLKVLELFRSRAMSRLQHALRRAADVFTAMRSRVSWRQRGGGATER